MDLDDRDLRHLARCFASERVSIWEYKHGPLGPDSRDCMVAIIYGAIITDPKVLQKIQDPNKELMDDMRRPTACFCDFLLDGETD